MFHKCFIPQHSHHRCKPPHSDLFDVLEQIGQFDVLFWLIQCTSSVYIITNESGWRIGITNVRSSICRLAQICTQTSWSSYSSVSSCLRLHVDVIFFLFFFLSVSPEIKLKNGHATIRQPVNRWMCIFSGTIHTIYTPVIGW